jgi:GAF domain-containing protein
MTVTDRLLEATRGVLAGMLGETRDAAGAAEASLLLPRGEDEMVFFASTNPALTGADVPSVPISRSFAGLAWRTGQTIAYADAAQQAAHFDSVDRHVRTRTREYAAIPCPAQGADHAVGIAGVLTLVNRPEPGEASRPFSPAELRHAETLAGAMAQPLGIVAGLLSGSAAGAGAIEPALLSDLEGLTEAERRVVHDLIVSLISNRSL